MPDLNSLLKLLIKGQLDFVLVGGFAAVVHGSSQVTRDLDLCLALNPKAIEKLRGLLRDFSPRIRAHPKKLSFLEHPQSIENVKYLYLETDLGALDLLTEIKGIGDFQRVSSRAVFIELFGLKCRVMSIQDLIAAKYAMGRDKDIATAKELEAIVRKAL